VFKLYYKAMALHDLGRTAEAQGVLDEMISHLAHSAAWQIAVAYAWFGEPDKAFEWMDRAHAQRDSGLAGLKYNPTSVEESPIGSGVMFWASFGFPAQRWIERI
jgi:hypothetical protein